MTRAGDGRPTSHNGHGYHGHHGERRRRRRQTPAAACGDGRLVGCAVCRVLCLSPLLRVPSSSRLLRSQATRFAPNHGTHDPPVGRSCPLCPLTRPLARPSIHSFTAAQPAVRLSSQPAWRHALSPSLPPPLSLLCVIQQSQATYIRPANAVHIIPAADWLAPDESSESRLHAGSSQCPPGTYRDGTGGRLDPAYHQVGRCGTSPCPPVPLPGSLCDKQDARTDVAPPRLSGSGGEARMGMSVGDMEPSGRTMRSRGAPVQCQLFYRRASLRG